jgi:hypothetical protein
MKKENMKSGYYKEAWKDKVMKAGCLLGFAVHLLVIIVGAITVGKCPFNS